MTSLITVFGMGRGALVPESGPDVYQPLGTVVIRGLLVGIVLPLLDISVVGYHS